MVASRFLLKTFALAALIAGVSAAVEDVPGELSDGPVDLKSAGIRGNISPNGIVASLDAGEAANELSRKTPNQRQQLNAGITPKKDETKGQPAQQRGPLPENRKDTPKEVQGDGRRGPKQEDKKSGPRKESDEPCPELPPTKSDGETCKTLKNKDRQGADLASVPGEAASCGKACESNSGCRTWSWSDFNGGTCWLKSVESPLVSKEGVISTECLYNLPLETCTLHLDIDLAGQDIGNKPAAQASMCCDICKGFDKCTAWSWNSYNGGTCWLKKNIGRAFPNPGVVSSSIEKLETAVCAFEYDVDFVGKDIGNELAKNKGECCSKCKSNNNCKAFTWTNFNGGTCWMKSGKGDTVSKPGAISSKLA